MALDDGQERDEELRKGLLGRAGTAIRSRMRRIGEGPKSLRALSFFGGLGVVCWSIFNLLNIYRLLGDPAGYLLQFCTASLGFLVMLVESKEFCAPLKGFCEEWAKFLTVPGGKGCFYMFLGLLVMSEGLAYLSPSFLLGGYMMVVGLMAVIYHPYSGEAQSRGYSMEGGATPEQSRTTTMQKEDISP